jgi:hypothetical protein
MIALRFGGSGTHFKKGKCPMTQPAFKRPQPTTLGQNNSGCHGNFRGDGNKGASSRHGPWKTSKDAKVDFKGHFKSTSFDINSKRDRSSSDRNYDSWNIAKKRLFLRSSADVARLMLVLTVVK